MRRNSLLTLILGLMLAGIGISKAQTPITLMEHTNVWRYLLTNALPAANWFASNYPPANTWSTGRATFAFPASEPIPPSFAPVNTTLALTTPGGSYIQTFYFRTTVNLATNPNLLISVNAAAVIDDGAVFYVNGREVGTRVRMPTGAINHGTSASAGGEVGTTRIDTFTIDPTNFVQGVNVIAVEVHQDGAASSDMVFGLRLTADVGAAPVITQHPQDREVDVPAPATFTVAATGTAPLTYRWYTNGVLVPGQSGTSYTISPTSTNMNGRIIHASVSNRFGIAISSNAVLTAVIDRNGPLLTSALSTSPLRLEANFNESLRPGNAPGVPTTNLANYVVNILGTTNKVPITSLVYGVNRMLLNLGEPITAESNYVLCVYNLQDTKTNTTPQDCIGVSFIVSTNIFELASSGWRFADVILDCRMDMTNWTSETFREDPFDWANGAGMFWFDQVNFNPSCSIPLTELSNFVGTQYFRKFFTVGSSLGTSVTMRVTYLVDDGAVFYVNGTEVYRVNMPAGRVTCDTLASSILDDSVATNCQTFAVSVDGSIFNVGTNNVFAVELHQVADQGAQNDMVFDASLNFVYRQTPIVPTLNVARTYTTNFQGRVVATNAVVTWVGTGWQLQHATAPTGTWQTISASVVMGTNRYSTPVAQQGPRRFYRLKNP